MKPIQTQDEKAAFRLILNLAKALRSFQDDSVFCENITYTQFAVLDYVAEAGGMLPLSKLHALLGVEKSTTTRLAAPLIDMALLIKRRAAEDARAFELVLTEAGARTHAVVWECLSGNLRKMLAHLPATEFGGVLRGLDLFTDALARCCRD